MHVAIHLGECDPEVHSRIRDSLVAIVATFGPDTSYSIGYSQKKGITVTLQNVKSIHPDLLLMLVHKVLRHPRNVISATDSIKYADLVLRHAFDSSCFAVGEHALLDDKVVYLPTGLVKMKDTTPLYFYREVVILVYACVILCGLCAGVAVYNRVFGVPVPGGVYANKSIYFQGS